MSVISQPGIYVGRYAVVGRHCAINQIIKLVNPAAQWFASISSALMCRQSTQHCLYDTTKPSAGSLAAAAAAAAAGRRATRQQSAPSGSELTIESVRHSSPTKSSQTASTFNSSQAPFHQWTQRASVQKHRQLANLSSRNAESRSDFPCESHTPDPDGSTGPHVDAILLCLSPGLRLRPSNVRVLQISSDDVHPVFP